MVDAKYSGTAKVASEAEHQRLYDMMAKIYPPYIEYQKKTDRQIPVVILHPEATIDRL